MKKEIEISGNGYSLNTNLFLPNVGKANGTAILCIHGWESGQDRYFDLSEAAAEHGYVAMTFDMRGHGKTGGNIESFSRKDFLDDCILAYDYLAKITGVDPKKIVVAGSSFGGYLATLLTEKRSVYRLAIRVPANYRDAEFELPLDAQIESPEHKSWRWKKDVDTTATSRTLGVLRNFQRPVLLVESELDESVSHEIVLGYLQSANPENITYKVMKGAPHSLTKFPEFKREYIQILFDWLALV